MMTHFILDRALLTQARARLFDRRGLYWLVGGSGAGKSTVCRTLSAGFDIPVYDMDAHIYGSYHGRFTPTRHPVNYAWSQADNGLAWLLSLSGEAFDAFNRAALAEYLDLLAEDLEGMAADGRLLIDGGICNPALLAQAIPASQIVCLTQNDLSSRDIWETGDRLEMKEMVYQLPNPEEMWRTFLAFDGRITQTILQESQAAGIPICSRDNAASIDQFARQTAAQLRLTPTTNDQPTK